MTQQKKPQPNIVTPEALAAVLEQLIIAGNVLLIFRHVSVVINFSVAVSTTRGQNEAVYCAYHACIHVYR